MQVHGCARCFGFSGSMFDACAVMSVYLQKAPAPVTPVKVFSGGATGSPATPVTAQKAVTVKMEVGHSELEVLLKQMQIDIQTLRNAAAGKSKSAQGLNIPEIEQVLNHFKIDISGKRADLNSKLSGLLASLGV